MVERSGRIKGTRDKLVTQGAQDLLDTTETPGNIRATLTNNLYDYYSGLSSKSSELRDFNVSRYTRAAFLGAFFHLGGQELISDTLPKIQKGESLIPDEIPSYLSIRIPRPYAEPYHTFVGASYYWFDKAQKSVLNSIDQNPHNTYAPLMEELESVYTDYSRLEQQHNSKPGSDLDMRTSLDDAPADNAQIVMWPLIAREKAADRTINSEELTRRTLGDIDTLSWLASINAKAFTRMCPYPFDSAQAIVGGEAFEAYDRVFEEVGEKVVYRNNSLKNGPLDDPRACAGRLPLTPSDPEKQREARAFFALAEQRGGSPIQVPNDGTFDTVKAFLVVGAHIAEHTIFTHRSSQ